jgi:transcriptional regulator with XRE-family HTH domain
MSEIDWIDIFADNLADILKDRNMSQRELAYETNISESVISRYISKERMPSLINILKISYAVDVDVNELIDFGEPII